MRSKQDIAGLGHSNTPKRFKFVLSSRLGNDLVLTHAPDGWKEGELTFIRDKEYKGVIQSFSTNELTFVKEGRDYIQRGYESGGIDFEIKIKIYLLQNSNFKYQLYFTGKLDLSTYKIDSIGVTCEVTPTGFQDVVLNRDDLEVNVRSTKFIGGGDGSMEALSGVPQGVTIPKYSATQNADWRFNGQSTNVSNYSHYLPMDNYFNEYSVEEVNDQDFDETTKFFVSDGGFDGNITGDLNVLINGSGSYTIEIYLRIRTIGGAISTVQSYTHSGTNNFEHRFTVDEAVSLGDGDSLYFEGYLQGDNATIAYSGSTVSLYESIGEDLPQISPYMFYIYEAFYRVLQLISGRYQCFYSEFLGRTDSVFEAYDEDGEGSLMAITSGKWIREFDWRTNPLNLSLKDLFKTINGIHNVGLEFSEDSVGREAVRLEKEQYFYDIETDETKEKTWKTNQILDLSSWLNNENIEKEVLPDWYANEVEVGYSKFEYENIQGLKEFNTISTWAIPIRSVKSKLDLTSAYRADTQGVNKLSAKPVSKFPTEDVSGDNDIFVFDVKRGGASPVKFTVKTDEDFDKVSGGVDTDQSYNLNFTPRRNLERHGNRFRAMQIPLGKELQWLKSDKNISLETQATDEDSPKLENEDIQLNTFTAGYWIPEAYIFEAPVDEDVISAIQDNPRGVIKIGTDKYGWILEVQTNSETRKGSFKLLKVDLNNVRVVS